MGNGLNGAKVGGDLLSGERGEGGSGPAWGDEHIRRGFWAQCAQEREEVGAGDSLGTVREEVGIGDLAVDEGDAQLLGVCTEMGEGYFGAIGLKGEHGLSTKEVAHPDSVESAQKGALWCVNGEACRSLSCVEVVEEAAKNGG